MLILNYNMLCEAQKKMLLEFMNRHEELRSGKFSLTFTYKTAQKLWESIASELNSVPNGGKKDWKRWRKTWQDMKKASKAKNAAINTYSEGTGGGPTYSKALNAVETEVLDMMSPIQTSGLGVGETPIEFSFNEKELEVAADENMASTEINENILTDHTEWLPTEKILVLENKTIQLAKNDSAVQVSTEEIIECPSEDHNYNLTYPTPNKNRLRGPPKKIIQTSRLQTSIKLSQIHLKSLDEKYGILTQYYKTKILLKNREIRTQLRTQRYSATWWKNLSP